jgi:chorismate dehydratase
MDPIRIACVRYLNTVPLIEGLDKVAGVELILTVPSRIADMVGAGVRASGGADLGLCSLIDAARSPTPLALMPVGMIGCDGPTHTVRLFSSVPIERITRIHADADSHTSIALCRVLLAKLHDLHPRIIDFDAREQIELPTGKTGSSAASEPAAPETLLLIGDKVVTDPPAADRYPHQLDLGEAWKALTGLPFVYAVWMCRAADADTPRIRAAAAVLDRQRRHNRTRLDWIIRTRAPEHRWPSDLAARYLGSLLRYEVGAREREAAQRFIDEAAALQLIPGGMLQWTADPAEVATAEPQHAH